MARGNHLVRKLDLSAGSASAPAPKSPRIGEHGGAAGHIEENITVKEMVLHLQNLSLQTVLTTRELSGCLHTTIMVPIGTQWAAKPAAAGKAYAQAVKGNPGHDLGPPWPHTAYQLLMAMTETLLALGANKEQQHKFLVDLLAQTTQPASDQFNLSVLQEIFTCCRAREIQPRKTKEKGADKKKPEKTKDKSKMEVDPDRILLSVALNPYCALQCSGLMGIQIPSMIRTILLDLTLAVNGEISNSGPPPWRSEREVYGDRKKLAKQIS